MDVEPTDPESLVYVPPPSTVISMEELQHEQQKKPIYQHRKRRPSSFSFPPAPSTDNVLRGASGEDNGAPLQHSCLENPMDGEAWWAAVHRFAEGRTRLSDFTFTFHFHALEKEMATHSSVLAWRIPGTGEPGGLPSMGSHRVGHD